MAYLTGCTYTVTTSHTRGPIPEENCVQERRLQNHRARVPHARCMRDRTVSRPVPKQLTFALWSQSFHVTFALRNSRPQDDQALLVATTPDRSHPTAQHHRHTHHHEHKHEHLSKAAVTSACSEAPPTSSRPHETCGRKKQV